VIVFGAACKRSGKINELENTNLSRTSNEPKPAKEQEIAHDLFKIIENTRYVYDPRRHDYVAIRDRRDEIAAISRSFSPTTREKHLFLQRGLDLNNQRKLRLGSSAATATGDSDKPPVPGGLGGGVFFRDSQLMFSQSSANYNYIVTPAALGGNTADFFYLTATNRAGRGCEAFVSYSRQDKPLFRVFDWAKNADHQDPWVVSIPYDRWGAYKLTYNIAGQDYDAVYTINATHTTDGNNWWNEVYLYNGETQTSDLVWSYSFQWTPANEKEKNDHWWGPILETFSSDYGDTNTVGFAEARLVQDGRERLLLDSNSFTGNDGSEHGFQVFHLNHNYTYLAR